MDERSLPELASLSQAPAAPSAVVVHPYIEKAVDQVERLLADDPLLRARVSKEMTARFVPAEGTVISSVERARLAARCALKARAGDIDHELDDLLQALLRGRQINPIDANLARELVAGLRLNVSNADVRALDALDAALICAEADGPEADEALARAVEAGAEAIALRARQASALCAEALADYIEMVGVRIGAPAQTHEISF